LTSEDEERETWTAESLRVSLLKSFGFSDRDRTKDFGGTRFEKGYTMISSLRSGRQRCESLRDFGVDLVKRCDQPVQSFKSNLRV
jgi:hypothetical protein